MHDLFADPLIGEESLTAYMEKYSANDDVESANEEGSCPIHLLLANPSLNASLLNGYLDKFGWTIELADGNERTAFMILCSNPEITLPMLIRLIRAGRDFDELSLLTNTAKETGETALHCLCRNPATNVNLIQELVSVSPSCVSVKDRRGNTPAMHLASNPSCSVEMLSILRRDAAQRTSSSRGKRGKRGSNARRASIGTPVDL